MPKVSINILTKNRAQLLQQALLSVQKQKFKDYEVVVVNDGSTDETEIELKEFSAKGGSAFGGKEVKIITHPTSLGITASRQEALLASRGEYIAVLDDDDEWIDLEKLSKQVKYLDTNTEFVLLGGGKNIMKDGKSQGEARRPVADIDIRKAMLFRNNFFTSTVMFRRASALAVGGFIKDESDFTEDYDLWLRMGRVGKMYNFQEVFTLYRQPNYNKERFKAFLKKQLRLISQYKKDYPGYWLASLILKARILF